MAVAPPGGPVGDGETSVAPAHQRGLGQFGLVVVPTLDPTSRGAGPSRTARGSSAAKGRPSSKISGAASAATRTARGAAAPARRRADRRSRRARVGSRPARGRPRGSRAAAVQPVEHPVGPHHRPARPRPRDDGHGLRRGAVTGGGRGSRAAAGRHQPLPTRRTAAPPPRATNPAASATASATAASTVAPAASPAATPPAKWSPAPDGSVPLTTGAGRPRRRRRGAAPPHRGYRG